MFDEADLYKGSLRCAGCNEGRDNQKVIAQLAVIVAVAVGQLMDEGVPDVTATTSATYMMTLSSAMYIFKILNVNTNKYYSHPCMSLCCATVLLADHLHNPWKSAESNYNIIATDFACPYCVNRENGKKTASI